MPGGYPQDNRQIGVRSYAFLRRVYIVCDWFCLLEVGGGGGVVVSGSFAVRRHFSVNTAQLASVPAKPFISRQGRVGADAL